MPSPTKVSSSIATGAFINISAVAEWLTKRRWDVVISYSFECDQVKVVPVFAGEVIEGADAAGLWSL